MTTTATTGTTRIASPHEYGIGARVSIHPHRDDFVDVILGALDDVAGTGLADGLALETDEVSTYVGVRDEPADQRLTQYLAALIAAAARRSEGGHVVAHLLLSRGCPCVRTCDLSTSGRPDPVPVHVEATGVPAVAHWVLYPLLEGGGDDHLPHIKAGIAAAEQRGTVDGPTHYATRLSGDVADVLASAVDAWARVGASIPHVVSHLTVSIGSPSPSQDSDGARPGLRAP